LIPIELSFFLINFAEESSADVISCKLAFAGDGCHGKSEMATTGSPLPSLPASAPIPP